MQRCAKRSRARTLEKIKLTYDDLQNKFQSVSEDLYKQAAASAGASAQESGTAPGGEQARPKGEGDVVDAEFEVVDEEKNKKK